MTMKARRIERIRSRSQKRVLNNPHAGFLGTGSASALVVGHCSMSDIACEDLFIPHFSSSFQPPRHSAAVSEVLIRGRLQEPLRGLGSGSERPVKGARSNFAA